MDCKQVYYYLQCHVNSISLVYLIHPMGRGGTKRLHLHMGTSPTHIQDTQLRIILYKQQHTKVVTKVHRTSVYIQNAGKYIAHTGKTSTVATKKQHFTAR